MLRETPRLEPLRTRDAREDADRKTHVPMFWGEMSPCEHLVQIYRDEAVLMSTLVDFVSGGLLADDGVIVIATPEHRQALAHRLDCRRIDVAAAAARNQYIVHDAAQTLAKFMVMQEGRTWPDKNLFERVVNNLLAHAATDPYGKPRRVRAFGEMVALLWQDGLIDATLCLETLWHEFCRKRSFCLFCAYPRSSFTHDAESSMHQIREAHSRSIPG